MEPHILFCASTILTTAFFLTTLPKSYSQEDDWYKDCELTFSCGNLGPLYYPFWSENLRPSYCGRKEFQLYGCQGHQFPSIRVGSQTFNVTWIDPEPYSFTMTMVRADLAYDDCSSNLTDTSLTDGTQFGPFSYGETVKNVTLFYDCPSNIPIGLRNFTCQAPSKHRVYYLDENEGDGSLQQFPELQQCGHRILVPISDGERLDAGGIDALIRYLNQGFHVNYTNVYQPHCIACGYSGGSCGSVTNDASQFTCYCQDGAHASDCNDFHGNKPPFRNKVIVAVTAGALAASLICVILSYCIIKFWTTTKVDKEIEAFIRNHGPLALTRYKFSNVKKMTKSFKVKLGQGGYGTVYKGKLPNGCSVAVKMLTSSKGNGQEFINEVASISRTSHVNIVSLLGFCLEGRKKALIYEFMPNGSLDKFVSKVDETNVSLSWENLYQIALGTARGLEYLHRGCNTRILHFDIKPHNILLDESFCPKISDFGLAKICPKKESIISISDPRGTIGYLAPEVWNRNIGGVSHKSDVYSYGMLLLDMAGGRQKMNNKTNCTTEIYFPDWIYDRLELDHNLGRDGITTAEEHVFAKKMTIVGLWCIQTFPTHRPKMSRVIEMLEGSLDSLEMPPRPVMSSSTRIEQESSTTSTY